MHLNDRLTIDATRRTVDGFLAVNARVAKAGNVQLYRGDEVGRPDLGTVRVYRPRDEVSKARPSFAHKPVTLGHPSSAVTADNWASLAKGWSGDEVAIEGDIIRVPMLLADAEAIKAVEGGTRQLSMGYDCSLDWTPGTSPAGEAYDAIQRDIRGNHIALVTAARGGPELTIGDSMSTTNDGRPTAGMTIDQAAALPFYDSYRGLFTDYGEPLERHMAMIDLERQGADGQRVAAARDHMVDELTGRTADGNDPASARAKMLADMAGASR